MMNISIKQQIKNHAKNFDMPTIEFFKDKIEIGCMILPEIKTEIRIKTTEECQEYQLILYKIKSMVGRKEYTFLKCTVVNSYMSVLDVMS